MKHTFLFVVLFFLLMTPTFTFAQPDESVVVEYLSARTEPVKIVSLTIGDTPIKSGEQTTTSKDLIKDLKATIINKYGKTVSFIELGIIVARPEGQEDKPPFHYTIWLGNRRKALKQEDSGLNIPSDSENDEIDLPLPAAEYKSIRAALDKLGYPLKIKKVEIQIEEVAFTDGTVWAYGYWFRADPNNDDKLIRINSIN